MIIDKKKMSEEDIKLNFITPAILKKGCKIILLWKQKLILITILFTLLLCSYIFASSEYESYKIYFNNPEVTQGDDLTVVLTADSGSVSFSKIIIKLEYDKNYLSFIDGEYITPSAYGFSSDLEFVSLDSYGFINISCDRLLFKECTFNINFKALKEGKTQVKVNDYKMYNNYGNTQYCDKVESSTINILKNPNYKEPIETLENNTYTVREGDTLWNIASNLYGDGSLFTKIYNANLDKIIDSKLIYGNQTLKIP